MDDLVTWLPAQVDEDERVAIEAAADFAKESGLRWRVDSDGNVSPAEPVDNSSVAVGSWGGPIGPAAEHIARHDPAHELNVVAAHRAILAEHLPQWQTVEWDHDQNGKGEALCCPRCQNAEHSEWNPPLGRARGLPEGFVTPYVLAPCHTLRLLALPYADRPGYQERWRPAAADAA